MSDDALNPYAAPKPGYAAAGGTTHSGRPRWYTFYCIMAIVLGALGASNALFGIGGVFVGQFFEGRSAVPVNAAQNMKEMIEIQNEMVGEMRSVNNRFYYFLLATNILHLLIGIALLVAGVRALSMTVAGAKLLGLVFVVTSVVDLGRLALGILLQMETGQIMQKHYGPLLEKSQMPYSSYVSSSMVYLIGAGICIGVVWTIFKLWLYLSGWVYFKTPDVQALLKD